MKWLAVLILPLTAAAPAASAQREPAVRYVITELPPASAASAGASINNLGWVAGQTGGEVVRATLWRGGRPTDLGDLGGPNSAVLWPVKNDRGIVVGIAQTAATDERKEAWSCGAFIPVTGNVCRGFVWQHGVMRALSTHGGTHGFATGANNRGLVVGWAEVAAADPSCNAPQVLGFRAATWDTTDRDRIRDLPPLAGDSASAATAVNDRGLVVGISGSCADAVGGFSARHAVLWENGRPRDLGGFGGTAWNTPMAVNDWGMVVGFANSDTAVGDAFDYRAFVWTTWAGFRHLGPPDLKAQALGVNNLGQVVGLCRLPTGQAAVLWQHGRMIDLNDDAVDSGYQGRLRYANDINDRGVITGQARNTAGQFVTFVATPVRR